MRFRILLKTLMPIYVFTLLSAQSPPGWRPLGNLPDATGVNDIIQLPWAQEHFVAVGYDRVGNHHASIWHTGDGGLTWNYVNWQGGDDWFMQVSVDTQNHRVWAVAFIGNTNTPPLYYSLDNGVSWNSVGYPESVDSVGFGWRVAVINGYVYYGGQSQNNKTKLYRLNTTSPDPNNWVWEYVATFNGCDDIGWIVLDPAMNKVIVFAEKSSYDSIRVYALSLDAPATNVSLKSLLPGSAVLDVSNWNSQYYVAVDSSDVSRVYSTSDFATWTLEGTWSEAGKSYNINGVERLGDTLYIAGSYTSGSNDYPVLQRKVGSGVWEDIWTPVGVEGVGRICRCNNGLWIATYPYGDIFESTWNLSAGGIYIYGPTQVFRTLISNDTLIATTNYNYTDLLFILPSGGISTADAPASEGVISIEKVGDEFYIGTGTNIVLKTTNFINWETTYHLPGATDGINVIKRFTNGNIFLGTSPYGDVFRATNSFASGGIYLYGPTLVNVISQRHDTLFFGTNYDLGEICYISGGGLSAGIWRTFNDESQILDLMFAGNDTVYVGTDSGRVKLSLDGGNTWLNTYELPGVSHVLRITTLNTGELIIGTSPYGDVFRATYKIPKTEAVYLYGPTQVFDVSPLINGSIYITTNYDNGEVWYSADGGNNWVNLIGPSQPWTKAFTIVPIGDTLYVGTDYHGNVYKSPDGGVTWDSTGELTGASEVRKLVVSRWSHPYKMYAATFPSGDVFLSSARIFDPSGTISIIPEPEYTCGQSNTVYVHGGLTAYKFQSSIDSLFNNIVETSGWVFDTSYTFSGLQSGVRYFYRVKGLYGVVNTDWSTPTSSIQDAEPPLIPIRIYPHNNAYLNALTSLIWHKAIDSISGASGYHLRVAYDSDFQHLIIDTIVTDTFCLINFGDSTYYWRIRAFDRVNNASTWSSTWSFTIDSHAPSMPTPLAPAGPINQDPVFFFWGRSSGRTLYSTKINHLSGNRILASPIEYVIQVSPTILYDTLVVFDTTSDTTYLANLPQGQYYWRIKSFDLSGNESPFSNSLNFIVDIEPPPIPSPLSPGNNDTVSQFPTLYWTLVDDNLSGFAGYRLQVSTSQMFNSLIVDTTILDTFLAINLGQSGWFYWRVKSIDVAGNQSAWSAIFSFKATTVSTPILVLPEDSSLVMTNYPTFVWSESPVRGYTLIHRTNSSERHGTYQIKEIGSRRYRLSVSPQKSITYTLQYSESPDFQGTIVTIENIPDTFFALPQFLPLPDEVPIFWRVQAVVGDEASGFQSHPFMVMATSRGDLNGDDVVDYDDIPYLANYLFYHSLPPVPLRNADLNGDCEVTPEDLAYLILLIRGDVDSPLMCVSIESNSRLIKRSHSP